MLKLNESLIEYGDRIIIGLSGGADSVALFYSLLEIKEKYNLNIICVHINHGIRESAVTDETFCKAICEKEGIEIICYSCDCEKEAKESGETTEQAGRRLRYAFFNDALNKTNSNKIATAHNLNDNAETMLLHLLRGSGLNGLCAIPARRGNIIRPLLGTSRKEIEEYLNKKGVSYQTDETNYSLDYSRNVVRLKILPLIEEYINPSAVQTLSKTSALICDEDNYLQDLALSSYKDCLLSDSEGCVSLCVNKLKTLDTVIQRRVIRIALSSLSPDLFNISFSHIQSISELLSKQSGKEIALPFGLSAEICFDKLLLRTCTQANSFCYNLEINKELYISETDDYFLLTDKLLENKDYTISINYDKIYGRLVLRSKLDGDKIYLAGIGGNKSLKKIFSENKIPKNKRDKIPVLSDDKEIIWIKDLKTNDRHKANSQTKNKLYLYTWGGKHNERNNKHSHF